MDDSQLERYSRQLLLPEIDLEGQEILADSKIMIVGVGGLGNIAAMALAGAGVGTLHLWDEDQVELSNLPRQSLYSNKDIGKDKAEAARSNLADMNPDTVIHTYPRLDNASDAKAISDDCDLILDCCDNIATRQVVNRIAVESATPLIAGAAIRFEGQLMTFLNNGGPCYECLSAQMPIKDVACRDVGILNTQVMLIGTFQAHVALKHLLGVQQLVDGQLLIMDGKQDDFQRFMVTKSASCSTCA